MISIEQKSSNLRVLYLLAYFMTAIYEREPKQETITLNGKKIHLNWTFRPSMTFLMLVSQRRQILLSYFCSTQHFPFQLHLFKESALHMHQPGTLAKLCGVCVYMYMYYFRKDQIELMSYVYALKRKASLVFSSVPNLSIETLLNRNYFEKSFNKNQITLNWYRNSLQARIDLSCQVCSSHKWFKHLS